MTGLGPVPGRAESSARALRAALYAGGSVATAAGTHTMLTGERSVPGRAAAARSVDSELRYYGAFYAAFGLTALRIAGRAEREPRAVRALAAAVFAGGLARLGGWRARGRPHPGQVALLAIELGVPPALLALQGRATGA